MKTREFESHEEIAEWFEDHPKKTNWIILDCYKEVLDDGGEDTAHPFSFKESGERFFIEVSKGEAPTGLARLMSKAVDEEHYEVAQGVKELSEEHDVELREGSSDNMHVVEEGSD